MLGAPKQYWKPHNIVGSKKHIVGSLKTMSEDSQHCFCGFFNVAGEKDVNLAILA